MFTFEHVFIPGSFKNSHQEEKQENLIYKNMMK